MFKKACRLEGVDFWPGQGIICHVILNWCLERLFKRCIFTEMPHLYASEDNNNFIIPFQVPKINITKLFSIEFLFKQWSVIYRHSSYENAKNNLIWYHSTIIFNPRAAKNCMSWSWCLKGTNCVSFYSEKWFL